MTCATHDRVEGDTTRVPVGRPALALRALARFWVRAGERVFHYQLLRAQIIERALMPDDRCGESR